MSPLNTHIRLRLKASLYFVCFIWYISVINDYDYYDYYYCYKVVSAKTSASYAVLP